jgi:formylglycine-generating enzyme required for sulfatase activity
VIEVDLRFNAPAAHGKPAAVRSVENMAWIAGGCFEMGSSNFYPEEGPVHTVRVEGFWIDRTPVTNHQFSKFVKETGYRTVAEQSPDPALYPGADPALLQPGSLVFRPPSRREDMRFWGDWWQYVAGACWFRPDGLSQLGEDRMDHPVVHVCHADAAAYAQWSGKNLPSEAEWEFAARGGLDGADYAWGNAFEPGGRRMANVWDGAFPMRNPETDAFGTSAVGCYPANAYGLSDMMGNVWEWTEDYWTSHHPEDAKKPCCVPVNPRVADQEQSYDPLQPAIRIPRKVLKGGSHLCAPSYCRRYRPAARQAEMIDSATTHVGFRCIVRAESGTGASLATTERAPA